MSGHYIAWTIDEFGVRAKVTCHEDADALCRFGCHDCEVWTRCDGRSWCPSCLSPKREPHCTSGHPLRAFEVCTVVEWFENATAYELYGGPPDHPIRDGLIELDWDDDGLTWHWPEPDSAQLAVTP